MDASVTNDFLYSSDWRQEVFAFGSLPFFDVMVDDKDLYLLKMPSWKGEGIKENAIFGLSAALGLVIFYAVGDARKRKYYEHLRSAWVTPKAELISNEYEKYVFLKVPLSELTNSLIFKGNKLRISYQGRKITLIRKAPSMKLQNTDPEIKRVKSYLAACTSKVRTV